MSSWSFGVGTDDQIKAYAPAGKRRCNVKSYTLYIHDGRYGAPALLVVELRDDDRVRAFAAERLQQSVYYQALEIWDGDRLVGKVGAEPPIP